MKRTTIVMLAVLTGAGCGDRLANFQAEYDRGHARSHAFVIPDAGLPQLGQEPSARAAAPAASTEPIQAEVRAEVGTDVKPSHRVTPSELVSAYEENEVRADARYKGSTLTVSGVVSRVGRTFSDRAYVCITDEQGTHEVQCMFGLWYENQLLSLNKGERIRVVGTGGGLMVNVLLTDCRIVDER
jgi:hypothetical protein